MKPVVNKIFMVFALAGFVGLVSSYLTDVANLYVYLYVFANILFVLGYMVLGKKTNNYLLQFSSGAFILLFLGYLVIFFNPGNVFKPGMNIFSWYLNLFGLAAMVYGISLFKLNKIIGLIVNLTAVLIIAGSVCLLTFRLFGGFSLDTPILLTGRILVSLACALEIIILARASKKKELAAA